MKFLVLMLTAGTVFSAAANDGGIAYIDVKGVNPKVNAGDGTQIEFYGKDAGNFMKLLPSAGGDLSLTDQKMFEQSIENQRSVNIVSNGWILSLDCSAGKVENLDENKPDNYSFVPHPAKCTISLNKKAVGDSLGDSLPMESKNYRNDMCN